MRADLVSRLVFAARLSLLVLALLGLAGCKTEKDPDQPTILGIPPATAYLGVEYYYNFGAYGGETILDYSLTNAPSWLALEDTNNKARQGIIMRGVPGLSGGNRGDQDLGKNEGVNLVTTDGRMSGVQPFDIEVKYNPLTLEASNFTEGEASATSESSDTRCETPALDGEGQHSFTINEYDENGEVTGSQDVSFKTRPVIVRVALDQPSVTRVTVAFELSSQYDASQCDDGFSAPHQRCDFGEANVGDAIVGQDLVALGSGSGSRLEELGYLNYRSDGLGGEVTFEPGITECFIRLEVIDDTFAEPVETALITLTEVREGLAGLGESNAGERLNLLIEDDEPLLTLRTRAGGTRDALNTNGFREYVARLSGDRDGISRARLIHTADSTARLDSEFVIEQEQGGTWLSNDELAFPESEDELTFRIRVLSDSYNNPDLNDRFIQLGLDKDYQAGRQNFAWAQGDNLLRVSLNELTAALELDSVNGFVATDLALAHSGRAFVAGYDSMDNDRIRVRIYDQKGDLLQDIAVSDPGDSLAGPAPVIATVKRKVAKGNARVDRFEFVVAYSTDQAVAGTTGQGGEDVVATRYRFDPDSNGGEYVHNWTLRTGTAGDDRVRSVAINSLAGYVAIAGTTNGTWPDQRRAGNHDSFLQRIDTQIDGSDEIPKVAWTRQVGSTADDSVAGAAAEQASPLLFGSARGQVNGESVLGGEDAFFYSASSADGALSIYQVGTDADEPVSAGTFVANQLWMVGASSSLYSVTENDDGETRLTRDPTASAAGFLLAYSPNGTVNRAFSLNDPGDVATERLGALTAFDNDMVVAGATDGVFRKSADNLGGGQAILARVSLAGEDADVEASAATSPWRYQLPKADSEILALANYRDDEILALARQGGERLLLVFSPEGRLLTALD
ncbi:MAG: hypothetical protein VYA91_00090 [Pseudomonadota bacterium]|nr:hypothetical protein [Pseudomonadota bacterium]